MGEMQHRWVKHEIAVFQQMLYISDRQLQL